MLEHVPKEVRSRGRIYTDQAERRDLGVRPTPYGQGTGVLVGLTVVDRDPEWDGSHYEAATFRATLGAYGEVYVPRDVQSALELGVGDDVRVTMASTDEPPEVEVETIDERVTVSG